MNISFICPTCGHAAANEFRQLEDFVISAYDDVIEWSEQENTIPPLNEKKFWSISKRSPKVGENRAVHVSYVFCEDLNSEFWTLYKPVLSSLDGWDEHPEEINLSAFVKCKVVKVLTQEENHAWIVVEVIDCIKLNQATERIPVTQETYSIVHNTFEFEHFEHQKIDNWHHFSGGAQGDLGNWMLIKEYDHDLRLIAYGEWGIHYQSAYLGNISLNP
ncbi:MAG: hypothetical protein QJT81_04260 [Candidatus Thiothrix putei]|uniref:DUF4178 domain-containing protein n=2 Tax=Thiothrix TaxID=1030 RepID=A0A1H4GE35_9GAMM|nr:hypothetical protein [Thiothrix caldifontis]WGZ95215.1 MAG: hypothetical protein QJT81_04260 [Candidatus Thiothrix putei]SEB07875.1 hypothetical protein SAMN05660964_03432 [Thiothrix caldifontis]